MNDLVVFVEVARTGGFRAAAEKLRLSAGTVSETVRRLEDRIGVRLLERTTRKSVLTAAGEHAFRQSLSAIDNLNTVLSGLDAGRGQPRGKLRLSAPFASGALFLNDLLAQYRVRYPEVDIEVIYDDKKVDLVTSGVDAVIRSETLLDQETHAVPVGPFLDMAIVAAPQYLERAGPPKTPSDVSGHDGICFAVGNNGRAVPWLFEGADGPYAVAPRAHIVVNDLEAVLTFAEAGFGLAYVYRHAAEPALSAARLASVLDGALPVAAHYSINYLTKRHMPSRLRAFIDLARREMRKGKGPVGSAG